MAMQALPPTFIVCGEALFDVFSGAPTAVGFGLDARMGGSPFNVALGLARLGQPVAFLGALSSDFLGQRLLRALRDEGVDERCVVRVDAPTTLGLVGLDDSGVPSYAFYGHGSADRQLTLATLPALPDSAGVLQLGSYAMVVEPVASALLGLVEREHGRRLIAYDVNVRLNVEPRVDAWRAVLARMLPRTDLLKLSEEDLVLLHPGGNEATLAEGWRREGVAWVVVTRGARGAVAYTPAGVVEVPGSPVQVVDTVGAGDTFQAALLAYLAETGALSAPALHDATREHVLAALDFSAKAAAITCTRRGADLPRRADLRSTCC
ncbi:carbohydrate kinase family protein [Ramlibacter tataouinensis]|uniref:Fructokinase-like protein n=1 Tax=Ramlibacter tataouinensis (strain ATCC BAA-407 / DSM 14655 / LMG 21543 / TTB310) TaxID=365046 RepID=F5Y3I4_RAMTT|nr:carbohydrate kinase [Ramlibacter tataouinensis]AEG92458.1 fructokinase-like protein [Ramlibacter tataouinensis TTB310]